MNQSQVWRDQYPNAAFGGNQGASHADRHSRRGNLDGLHHYFSSCRHYRRDG
jgi:hypothetical protein